jgi:hypothetical protein
MLYSVLIYDSEAVVGNLNKAEFDALIARHEEVQRKLAAEGKLGPVARLMPTTAATTLRQGPTPVVLDGPFAETKEQLLGFYIVKCATLEEAHEAARLIGGACGARALEVRPVALYYPGGPLQ